MHIYLSNKTFKSKFNEKVHLNVFILVSLLSGTRNDKNINLSQQIYDRIKERFPELTDSLTSATILLSNVYGSIGDMDKVSDLRSQLSKSGAKKKIGLSWTIVNDQYYVSRRLFQINNNLKLFKSHFSNFVLMIDLILDPQIFMLKLKIFQMNFLSMVINIIQVGLHDH